MSDIYKQIPFTDRYDSFCPCCRSRVGGNSKVQKVYCYDRLMTKAYEESIRLFYCNKCRIGFLEKKSRATKNLMSYNGRYLYLTSARNTNRQKLWDCIEQYPEEYLLHHREILESSEEIDDMDETLVEDYIEPGAEEKADKAYADKYFEKLNEKERKHLNVPKGTMGVFVYEMPEHKLSQPRKAFIVYDNYYERNNKINAYSIKHEYTRVILRAVADRQSDFEYQGIKRELIKCYVGKDLEAEILGFKLARQIEKASLKNPVTVKVYRGKGLYCNKHHIMESVTVNIIGARSSEYHPINVYYCKSCREYFVNDIDYRQFNEKYGIPPFRLEYAKGYGSFDPENRYDSYQEKSLLRLYGYYVSKDMADKSEYRKRLLEDLIDSGLIDKTQILLHLEFLMRDRSYQFDAVRRWRSDYEHILRYKMNKQRIVWGRIE